jgi:hypothetical protein
MATKIKKDSERLDNLVIEGKKTEFTVGELKHSSRIVKSATPKGDLSWWIKWISSIIVLVGITVRSAGIVELQWLDVFCSWLGAVGWFVVGMMWKDRALILLNGVISIMLFAGLLRIMAERGMF